MFVTLFVDGLLSTRVTDHSPIHYTSCGWQPEWDLQAANVLANLNRCASAGMIGGISKAARQLPGERILKLSREHRNPLYVPVYLIAMKSRFFWFHYG